MNARNKFLLTGGLYVGTALLFVWILTLGVSIFDAALRPFVDMTGPAVILGGGLGLFILRRLVRRAERNLH